MNNNKLELILAISGMSILLIFTIVMLIEANVYMTALTIVSTFATTIAAIATYHSASAAKESAKIAGIALENQIQDSILNNKPEIIPLNKYVELKFDDLKGKPHLCNWDTHNYDLEDRLFIEQVHLPIINVGKNFAKDIEVHWELEDFEQSISEMKKLIPCFKTFYNILEFKIREGISFNGLIILHTYAKMENGFVSGDEFRIDNLGIERLQILKSGEEININIPTSYVIFYNILVSIYHTEWRKLSIHPKLKLKIMYRDLDNRLYESNFKLGISKMQIGHTNFVGERNAKFNLVTINQK